MSNFPETRYSLIARLERLDDDESWRDFVTIYRPVVYRMARRRGIQHADAEDLTQRVFTSVRQSIGNWKPNATRGRFRSWLVTITRNAAINALTRRPPDAAVGGTRVLELLQLYPEKDDCSREILELELRRSLFRRAAERIRGEFREPTWNAFWLTVVEGQGVEETAAALGKSAGSVYAARSRIMRRLKTEIEAYDG
jgi:RNA polymerase sigma-70 factor, ECF subfamily